MTSCFHMLLRNMYSVFQRPEALGNCERFYWIHCSYVITLTCNNYVWVGEESLNCVFSNIFLCIHRIPETDYPEAFALCVTCCQLSCNALLNDVQNATIHMSDMAAEPTEDIWAYAICTMYYAHAHMHLEWTYTQLKRLALFHISLVCSSMCSSSSSTCMILRSIS